MSDTDSPARVRPATLAAVSRSPANTLARAMVIAGYSEVRTAVTARKPACVAKKYKIVAPPPDSPVIADRPGTPNDYGPGPPGCRPGTRRSQPPVPRARLCLPACLPCDAAAIQMAPGKAEEEPMVELLVTIRGVPPTARWCFRGGEAFLCWLQREPAVVCAQARAAEDPRDMA